MHSVTHGLSCHPSRYYDSISHYIRLAYRRDTDLLRRSCGAHSLPGLGRRAGRPILKAPFSEALCLPAAFLCFVSSVLFGLDGAYGLASAMAVIGGIHFVARGPLTHRINEARDAELAGQTGAKERFDRLHKLSVRLFTLQLLGVIVCALWVGA